MVMARLIRYKGSFAIIDKRQKKTPFIQFSLKYPFWFPHHETNDFWSIYGWLFFYFGWIKQSDVAKEWEISEQKQEFMRETEELMMREENFTQGEYVKKEDVMTYLKVFDWNMSREELIEKFKEMPVINLTEQDVNKVKINKLLNGEW